jgi:GDPmannose 4,6-dehydratase
MIDADLELVGLNSPGEGKKILQKKGIDWTKNRVTVG